MTYEEMVETAAKAARSFLCPGADWQELSWKELQTCMAIGKSIFAALRYQGLAVVPREPTENMLSRGWAGLEDGLAPGVLWSAMLAAGEIRPGEDAP